MSQETQEDVFYAFSVEPDRTRETLERYLKKYPQHRDELIDLSSELRYGGSFGGIFFRLSPYRKIDDSEYEEAWDKFKKLRRRDGNR